MITLVNLSILFLPSSPPSFIIFSSEGTIIPNNCTTIEDVINGVIDIANIDNLEKAPPEITLINPTTLFVPASIVVCNFIISTIGIVKKQPNLNKTKSNIV